MSINLSAASYYYSQVIAIQGGSNERRFVKLSLIVSAIVTIINDKIWITNALFIDIKTCDNTCFSINLAIPHIIELCAYFQIAVLGAIYTRWRSFIYSRGQRNTQTRPNLLEAIEGCHDLSLPSESLQRYPRRTVPEGVALSITLLAWIGFIIANWLKNCQHTKQSDHYRFWLNVMQSSPYYWSLVTSFNIILDDCFKDVADSASLKIEPESSQFDLYSTTNTNPGRHSTGSLIVMAL